MMKMINLKIKPYYFILLLLTVYSCLFDPKPKMAEELVPGETGSYWKYKILSYERHDYHNFADWVYEDYSSFLFELDDTTIIQTNTVLREISNIFEVEYENSIHELKAYTNTSLGLPKTV
jgi:hypothetical protein